MPDDEERLLQRCKEGDGAAFDQLVLRHRTKVLNLAYQIIGDAEAAEDVAQEAFVRAFRSLRTFRGESSFLTWLCRIALNLCFREIARRRPPAESSEAAANPASLEQSALERIRVRRALDTLGPELRPTLILRELHGLSYAEIASIMDVPVGTVRSRLAAARERFRKALEE